MAIKTNTADGPLCGFTTLLLDVSLLLRHSVWFCAQPECILDGGAATLLEEHEVLLHLGSTHASAIDGSGEIFGLLRH